MPGETAHAGTGRKTVLGTPMTTRSRLRCSHAYAQRVTIMHRSSGPRPREPRRRTAERPATSPEEAAEPPKRDLGAMVRTIDGGGPGRRSDLLVHVPTPGDHYSPVTGSATMTVIYELSRQHENAGGNTRVIVGRGTHHDYEIGECVEVGFHGLPSIRSRAVDVALGTMGFTRRFAAAAYGPALDAIEATFTGPVIVHNSPGSLRMFAEHRPRAALVLYVHNTLFRTYRPRELRRAVDGVATLVFVSHFLAEDFTGRLRAFDGIPVVVRNGVDTDRFRPRDATREDNDPLVLFVGRVIPEKGPDILVRAARRLHRTGRRFRLRIVGSKGFSATDPLSRYERRLRELAAPLCDAVEFVPFVDRNRILDEYARADVMCVPSNCDEGSTLTVPEALGCGIPTVASRRGGIPEVGGDAVLYFDPPSIDELVDRLAYLLDDPSTRFEWARRAREHALTLGWAPEYEKLMRALEA